GEPFEENPLQPGEPAELLGQDVGRPLHQPDPRLGRTVLSFLTAHDPAPSASATTVSNPACGIAFRSCRVARSRRLNVPFSPSSGPTITANRCPRLDPQPICLPTWIGSGHTSAPTPALRSLA